MTKVVVLTGGMGAGKSTASKAFEAEGITVVDADALAHQVTGPQGAAMSSIEEAFGPAVVSPDGSLNREAMRALAFHSPEIRIQLEAIVHPLVAEAARLALASATGPYAVYAVPLWVEKHGEARPDWVWRIVVIDLPEALQRTRIQKRSPLPVDQMEAMLARQARREERLAVADHVLSNAGEAHALEAAVGQLHQRFLDELCL